MEPKPLCELYNESRARWCDHDAVAIWVNIPPHIWTYRHEVGAMGIESARVCAGHALNVGRAFARDAYDGWPYRMDPLPAPKEV